jgi:hypothetical protein
MDMTKYGLYNKYTVINKETGEETTDRLFILKPDKDPAARAALKAYAAATDNEKLAKDLIHWADYEFLPCACREAMCGHLFGGYERKRQEANPL